MCGRYVLGERDIDAIESRFSVGVHGTHVYEARYNVAPSQVMPVVTDRAITFRPWGYAPPWADRPVINARIESLADKPYFREAAHCLVPATGFYEWKREDHRKVPYYFALPDEELFAFAGICNERGYGIVTTKASGAVADVHDRMPVILRREDENNWLHGTVEPVPPELACHEVSSAVNSPQHDTPDLLRPVSS